MKKGDKARVSPKFTGEKEWIEGEVIDVENNPFKGIVIAIKDKLGRIFFGEEKYFSPVMIFITKYYLFIRKKRLEFF